MQIKKYEISSTWSLCAANLTHFLIRLNLAKYFSPGDNERKGKACKEEKYKIFFFFARLR
jgi:hypothetical protein